MSRMLDTPNVIMDPQDRSNIANARVAGMQTALKLSNYQVSFRVMGWLSN